MLLNWLFSCFLCSLVLLVILNMMLFYKLWMLEYTTQTLTAWQGLRLQERYSHTCWVSAWFLWMSEAFLSQQSSGLSLLCKTGEAEGPCTFPLQLKSRVKAFTVHWHQPQEAKPGE